MCTVGARVTDCNLWISASLSLAYLKGPWSRSFDGEESVEWSYQGIWATSLLDSTRCDWTESSLGISNYLRTSVDSGRGSTGIVIKNLGCNGSSRESVTIKCLSHFPVVMGNCGTTGILATDTYCVFISSIDILFCSNSSCCRSNGKIRSRIVTSASSNFQSACCDGTTNRRILICKENSWSRCYGYKRSRWWIRNGLIC